jgi:DNA-binding NarL/FixJ family response regulator
MAEGWSTTEISERLYISPRTVEVHRANVMHKLDLHTQTDLVRYAIRRGLIAVDR